MVTATASIPGFCRIGAVRFIRRISHHQTFRCSTSTPHPLTNDTIQNPSSTKSNHDDASVSTNTPSSFFPKKNQTLELECESLAFKGKGVCKVSGTGFVVMCDRALPGERFIGRVTRKKGSYAEVVKLKTLVPHHDLVEAPCEYASDCGGCKMQNLLYEAQVRYKEQQVQELLVHVGRFTKENLEFNPIVPCSIQYHYRNKMEFSFCTDKWLPKDEMIAKEEKRGSNIRNGNDYALGLHVPGFFDKVIQIDKCLLQSEAADKVLTVIQDGWRSQHLDLSPYNVHTHKGFLKHLMLRSGSDPQTSAECNEYEEAFADVLNKIIGDDIQLKMKVLADMCLYKNKLGRFGTAKVEGIAATLEQLEWWGLFGRRTPEFKTLAMRILGLCCTAFSCERNWSTFAHFHIKSRNRLNVV